MPVDDSGRRRLAPEVRREAILAAARPAFADRSYGDVSVSDIATAAGVSQALVFKYFDSKAGLAAAVARAGAGDLAAARDRADAALPGGVGARDRVRSALLVLLDAVARADGAFGLAATRDDPAPAAEARAAARAEWLGWLRGVLQPDPSPRDTYALAGFLGFVDAAAAAWAAAGCPVAERAALVEAALGALEGALGDWRR